MPPPEIDLPKFTCPECQTGSLLLGGVTFAHWFEGQFIVIPDFPAWVCDVCGARDYDAEALMRLEAVLGPEADLRREARRRSSRRASDAVISPRPGRRHRA